MDKQEANSHKLLFSKQDKSHKLDPLNRFQYITSLLMMRKIMVIPLFMGEWISLFAATRRFSYYILDLSTNCPQISW